MGTKSGMDCQRYRVIGGWSWRGLETREQSIQELANSSSWRLQALEMVGPAAPGLLMGGA